MNISGWIFSGLIFLAFLFVSNKIMQYLKHSGDGKKEPPASTNA
jgi:hypothetical protein